MAGAEPAPEAQPRSQVAMRSAPIGWRAGCLLVAFPVANACVFGLLTWQSLNAHGVNEDFWSHVLAGTMMCLLGVLVLGLGAKLLIRSPPWSQAARTVDGMCAIGGVVGAVAGIVLVFAPFLVGYALLWLAVPSLLMSLWGMGRLLADRSQQRVTP